MAGVESLGEDNSPQKVRADEPGGTGSSHRAVVGAQGGVRGGQQFPAARVHKPGGTGSLAQEVVGAQGGPLRGSSPQQPKHTNLGGRGVPLRRWSVLKEGLQGVAFLNCPGSPAWGDGGFHPGGGLCVRRARSWAYWAYWARPSIPLSYRCPVTAWLVGMGDLQKGGQCVTPPVKGITCCTPRPNVPASYICTTNVAREVTHPCTDHRLGRTPHPPRLVLPGPWKLLPPQRPLLENRPPPRWLVDDALGMRGHCPPGYGTRVRQECPIPRHPLGRTGLYAVWEGRTRDRGPHGARYGPV